MLGLSLFFLLLFWTLNNNNTFFLGFRWWCNSPWGVDDFLKNQWGGTIRWWWGIDFPDTCPNYIHDNTCQNLNLYFQMHFSNLRRKSRKQVIPIWVKRINWTFIICVQVERFTSMFKKCDLNQDGQLQPCGKSILVN